MAVSEIAHRDIIGSNHASGSLCRATGYNMVAMQPYKCHFFLNGEISNTQDISAWILLSNLHSGNFFVFSFQRSRWIIVAMVRVMPIFVLDRRPRDDSVADLEGK